MSTLFGRFIPGVFILIIVFILLNALASFNNFQQILGHDRLVDHTRNVITKLEIVYTTIREAESAHRGYLLTGQKKYLDFYNTALSRINNDFSVVQGLISDNPEQEKRLTILRHKADARIATLKKSLAIRNTEGLDAAVVEIANEAQKEEMDGLQQDVQTMQQTEETLLQERQKQTTMSTQRMYATIAIATLLNLSLMAIAYILTTSEFKRRNALEQRKDEFISMASHELKTPITSQKVYTQVLRKETDQYNNEKVNRYIDKIDDQTNKLIELITNLLDLSRIQLGKLALNRESFNLAALIEDTVEAIQGTTRKHTIIMKGGIDETVYADRYRIYQVLVNLLTNAIKYAPKGGKIVIQIKRSDRHITVSVKDKGLGIANKHQKRIFERLYQVNEPDKERKPGLGMGLFISYQIIKQHDGDMWVESQKGKGSTFYFTLPITHHDKLSLDASANENLKKKDLPMKVKPQAARHQSHH